MTHLDRTPDAQPKPGTPGAMVRNLADKLATMPLDDAGQDVANFGTREAEERAARRNGGAA